MPISSTYRQTVVQPWNSTKSRRLSSTMPIIRDKNDEVKRVRSLSLSANRSTSSKSSRKPQAKPAWITGSFSLSETNDIQCLSTFPINNSAVKLARRTVKRRAETSPALPVFCEQGFDPKVKFKRSNSDSMLEPCELHLQRKSKRKNVSRARPGRKKTPVLQEKVEPQSKISSNNTKLCFNDYDQTPKELGQRVLCILNKQIRCGVVHYLGSTQFSAGQWCGIVLDEPCGKNDGCVKGVRYFTCEDNYGIFVHVHKVRTLERQASNDFRESDENLEYTDNATMDFSVKAELRQSCPLNDISSICSPKQISKSFSGDSHNLMQNTQCNNIRNELAVIAYKLNDSNRVIEQSGQCIKTIGEPSISCQFVSSSSSNTESLSNGIVTVQGKRCFSSDYITSVLVKSDDGPGFHAALERDTTIDAFDQDKYCSCPNLVPSQFLSSALEACIDLGRQKMTDSISEKSSPSPMEEESTSECDNILENQQESQEMSYREKAYPYGRSKSLPLVLVPVRKLSDTESLFWSSDKLSSITLKEERSVSWPALSTSAVRLDLRPDNKIDEARFFEDDAMHETYEDDDKKYQHEQSKTLKKQSAVDNLEQSDSESLHSESQLSISSVETNASRKVRKVSANSTSSTTSQTMSKPQRHDVPIVDDKNKYKRNIEVNVSPFKLTKRHTVSGLQKYQTTTLAGSTKPTMTKRPTSTLSSISSPTYGKSKLPTMKKAQLPATTASKNRAAKLAIRPTSISLKDAKKPVSIGSQVKEDMRKVTKNSSQKKPSSQKVKPESTVKKRSQNVNKPGQQTIPVSGKKNVCKPPSTKVDSPTKTKEPNGPALQCNTGSPTGKSANSPSRPYHSRLPRKITSRDGSLESSHSHEPDIDAVSIGTEESEYLDSNRLSRDFSYPVDHYDADRSDLESSTTSWQIASRAPDILTGTREIHRRSVEIQVDEENDALQKVLALERLSEGFKKNCQTLQQAISERDTMLLSSAILVTALCKKLQSNGSIVLHLKKDLHVTESELNQVQERLAEEEANALKLQEEMIYVRSEHTVAIQNLKADHENTLEGLKYSLNAQYTEEMKKVSDEHVKELVELNKVHEEKELEMKKHQDKTLSEVNEKYKDEIVELETKHSQHIDELLEEHQVEIETIKTDYEEQHGGIESKLLAATKECASLNMQLVQLKEDTERDIQSRIQEEIEKYKALPAELESMKAVLDMRNEENKQLKKERMESQMEVDHLRKIAERVRKLEHENESLSFVVENKSKFERQLSVEHEHLKNTLDRESKKLKRLSLENEELQWKLFQSSPTDEHSASFDTANGSPTNSPKRRSFRLSTTTPDVETIDE